ncbi:MAG: ABC transporter ATP-binding protein [Acidimicrobiales bacterium]
MAPPLLEVVDIVVDYGPVRALRHVSLEVGQGEMVALIGANGAGKTTMLSAISGLLPLAGGTIRLGGHLGSVDLSRASVGARVKAGIAHVPEGRRIFPGLSVMENLEMGAYLRSRRQRAEVAADLAEVLALFPRLAERFKQAGGTLSGGEQQMLAVGRALMARPRLLLADEPSMGLAPRLVTAILDALVDVNSRGTAVLLVEQNAMAALERCSRAYVLEVGEVVASGPSGELAADDRLRAAYLGVAAGSGPLRRRHPTMPSETA